MKKRSILVTCASAATVLLLSGCGTEQLKSEIAEVRSIAQEAKSSAQASADASAAAMSKAEAAASAAEAAQSCCDDNRERLDRVFRKSMNK